MKNISKMYFHMLHEVGQAGSASQSSRLRLFALHLAWTARLRRIHPCTRGSAPLSKRGWLGHPLCLVAAHWMFAMPVIHPAAVRASCRVLTPRLAGLRPVASLWSSSLSSHSATRDWAERPTTEGGGSGLAWGDPDGGGAEQEPDAWGHRAPSCPRGRGHVGPSVAPDLAGARTSTSFIWFLNETSQNRTGKRALGRALVAWLPLGWEPALLSGRRGDLRKRRSLDAMLSFSTLHSERMQVTSITNGASYHSCFEPAGDLNAS